MLKKFDNTANLRLRKRLVAVICVQISTVRGFTMSDHMQTCQTLLINGA